MKINDLNKIKERNAGGYALDDNDIEVILRTLDTSYRAKALIGPNNICVIPSVSIPFSTIEMVLKPILNQLPGRFPRKFVGCLKPRDIFHWNVIEITQTSANTVHCVSYDTNGYAYPVDDENMQQISSCFGTKVKVSTIDQRQQKYSFSGQKNNNCGIICALIVDDIRMGRIHDASQPLQQYGDLLSIVDIQSTKDREKINTLVEDYASDLDKNSFCIPRANTTPGGKFFDAQTYLATRPSPPQSDRQKAVYNALKKDPEALGILYNIIDGLDDHRGIFDAIYRQNEAFKRRVKYLFAGDEYHVDRNGISTSMGGDWIDTVRYAHHETNGPIQAQINPHNDFNFARTDSLNVPTLDKRLPHDYPTDSSNDEADASLLWTGVTASVLILAGLALIVPLSLFLIFSAFMALASGLIMLLNYLSGTECPPSKVNPSATHTVDPCTEPLSSVDTCPTRPHQNPQQPSASHTFEPTAMPTTSNDCARTCSRSVNAIETDGIAHFNEENFHDQVSVDAQDDATVKTKGQPIPSYLLITIAATAIVTIASGFYMSQSNDMALRV